jgi:glycosyltransferase involved in cell wall biosynthesis
MDAQLAVIVPAYNAEATLSETLEAILSTTIELDVVIVDDGSHDTTVAIAQSFAERDDRVRVLRQENAGPTAARSRGIAATSAPLFVCCDADDVWDEGFAATMVRALDANPEALLAVSDFRLVDHTGPLEGQSSYPEWVRNPVVARGLHLERATERGFAAAATRLCFPPPAGVVVRRCAFDAVGGFDGSISRSEDIECWNRLCQIGSFIFVGDAAFAYRVRPGQRSQSSGRKLGAVRAKIALLAKCRDRRLLKTAFHGGIAFYATLARERLRHWLRHREVRSLALALANLGVCLVLTGATAVAVVTPNQVRRRRFVGGLR